MKMEITNKIIKLRKQQLICEEIKTMLKVIQKKKIGLNGITLDAINEGTVDFIKGVFNTELEVEKEVTENKIEFFYKLDGETIFSWGWKKDE